jgi:hypothetical protein
MAKFEHPVSKPTIDVASFAMSGASVSSLLVEALDLAGAPRPLDGVFTRG